MKTEKTEIPTPEEIERVTAYLQASASSAQEAIVASKRQAAEIAQQTANDLVAQADVSGVSINRLPWDDTSIDWRKRGDITSIRLDFADGTQCLVSVNQDGDALELSITPGTSG